MVMIRSEISILGKRIYLLYLGEKVLLKQQIRFSFFHTFVCKINMEFTDPENSETSERQLQFIAYQQIYVLQILPKSLLLGIWPP